MWREHWKYFLNRAIPVADHVICLSQGRKISKKRLTIRKTEHSRCWEFNKASEKKSERSAATKEGKAQRREQCRTDVRHFCEVSLHLVHDTSRLSSLAHKSEKVAPHGLQPPTHQTSTTQENKKYLQATVKTRQTYAVFLRCS